MIFLQNSKDFRKVGLILSTINIILQVICFLAIAISFRKLRDLVVIEETETSYYIEYRRPLANIGVNALIFFATDIMLYGWLIYGLLKRRSGFLPFWLIYSIAELLIIETSLFIITLGLCMYYNCAWGIFSLVAQLLVTVYLYSNMCVVYTAYNQFVKVKLPHTPQVNFNVISSPPAQGVQYTTPQYVASQPQFAPSATAPTLSYPSHMTPNYDYSKTQQPPT